MHERESAITAAVLFWKEPMVTIVRYKFICRFISGNIPIATTIVFLVLKVQESRTRLNPNVDTEIEQGTGNSGAKEGDYCRVQTDMFLNHSHTLY